MITPEERRATARAFVAAEPPVVREPAGSPGHEPVGAVGRLQRLCRAAVRALPATGTAISVMTPGGVRAVAAASDPAGEALGTLQITLGEGPGIDAYLTRRPVLEPDLATGAAHRWPGYCAAVLEEGTRAVFAFPLQLGAARLGVLDVYRRSPGVLSSAALQQALTFAELGVEVLLEGQESAPPDHAEAPLDQALGAGYAVYQAQGMTTIDLGVSLAEAMARLQAYAYAQNRPLPAVARDIVAGRLRLERDDGTAH